MLTVALLVLRYNLTLWPELHTKDDVSSETVHVAAHLVNSIATFAYL